VKRIQRILNVKYLIHAIQIHMVKEDVQIHVLKTLLQKDVLHLLLNVITTQVQKSQIVLHPTHAIQTHLVKEDVQLHHHVTAEDGQAAEAATVQPVEQMAMVVSSTTIGTESAAISAISSTPVPTIPQ
jgi:hypothetical protein